MKRILFYTIMTTIIVGANTPETEIGINIGAIATKNEHGSKFKSPTFGVTYQNNSYVVMPRVDIEYVKLNQEQADALIKASINGVYEYENKTNVSPYILAGVGYEKVQGEVSNIIESHPFIQGGAGIRIDIQDGYKARVEGKFLQILGGNDEENEAILTAGVSIPLSYSKPIRPVKVRVQPIIRVKPIKPIIIRQAPKVIFSNNNECSIKISAPDLDRDGIENRFDQCPATPCNFSVDSYGCPIKATLKIHFKTGSSTIEGYSMVKVNEFSEFLLRNKGSRVTILGHTDSVGSAVANQALSFRRAKAVVQSLIAKGVSPARIHAEGKGESMPVASNKTLNGKAMNRRIEAVLSYPEGRR